ncbi:MAG: hypothetical protein JWO48_1133, partial [Bryobacterales bacterium]|nr:hypothetical protein [Bryobacterales bacterium]
MSDPTNADRAQVLRRAFLELKNLQTKVEEYERARTEPIAIVGVGCRFPGHVSDREGYWRLLVDGVDAITEIPPDRWDSAKYYDPDPNASGNKMYTRLGGFVDDVKGFDAPFFGITPREAATLDPQQRLLLEVTWEALENGGIAPASLADTATGVFVGMCGFDYAQLLLGDKRAPIDGYMGSGSTHSAASGRLSYFLGVRGPCLSVDTACSSSLVSVHLAMQSLRGGECNLALAGGVNLLLLPETTIIFSKAKMMSPDGHCKTFDAGADGYVRSEGCGMVVLKRLSDAIRDRDNVLAVIRGSAVNQDGRSSGLTVPNGTAQEEVLRAALRNAGVEPEQVGYVEAHGTGTSLGDPIEIRALSAVLNQKREKPFVVGSVKTNFGHLEGAAGVASLIKVALVLRHGTIPPHLHFETPNPLIDWAHAGAVVPTQVMPFDPIGGRRIAGVSSFGFSGTNAHLVLEEAPNAAPLQQGVERPAHILALSARTERALRDLTARYQAHLAVTEDPFENVCFTANAGRSHFAHRVAVVAKGNTEAISLLSQAIPSHREQIARPKIAFLFTGQGSQYASMSRQLYESSPVFRDCIDRCDRTVSVLEALYNASDGLIDQTQHTQVCLFAIEYALAELWRSFGVEPCCVMGHSVGEYAAAVTAGVMSVEDGIRLIARRASLMQALPRNGGMVSISASLAEVEPLVDFPLAIAAVNGPRSVVVSGALDRLETLSETLRRGGIRHVPLNVSHAFHSPLIDPMLPALRDAAREVKFTPPRLRMVSNLTGDVVSEALVADADYWADHARGTVQFQKGMETLRARGCDVFIEIGPHPVLLALGGTCLGHFGIWLPSLRKGAQDWLQICESAATLYSAGGAIDWNRFDDGFARRKVALPTYPFEHEQHWVEPSKPGPLEAQVSSSLIGREFDSPALGDQRIYETVLSADQPGFLRDHRISGMPVLPAAAYVGMALRNEGGAVEDLILHEPVILEGTQTRRIQLIAKGESFQVFSSSGKNWTLHAEGRLRRGVPDVSAEDLLAAVRGFCAENPSSEVPYEGLWAKGLQLGPAFRTVTRLWRGEREAVGEIRLPPGLERDAAEYAVHPILLDASLQVAGSLVASEGAPLLLPVRFDRIRVKSGNPAVKAFCRAIGRSGHTIHRIQLIDDAGGLIADIEGLHFRPFAGNRDKTWKEWIHDVDWEPRDLPIGKAELVEDLCRHVEPLRRRYGTDAWQEILPQLDDLSIAYVVRAFRALGVQFEVGENVRLSSARHQRLLGRMFAMLAEEGILESRAGQWIVQLLPGSPSPERRLEELIGIYPGSLPELTMLGRCGDALAGVLLGETDPLSVLFPG